MSVKYKSIHWNPQKKKYDLIIVALILGYLLAFIATSFLVTPNLDPVITLIRAFGSLALVMLHLVLIIGPLCRLNSAFLPLLYNRRHLGVSTFLVSAFHGVLALMQYHGGGNTNPIVSLFTANTQYASLAQFPFHVLGFFALLIFFLMTATSHDFWLKNLGQNFWKRLHMLIYVVYFLVIMHVMLGVIQTESSPILITILAMGFTIVVGLHLVTGLQEVRADRQSQKLLKDGYMRIGNAGDWEDGKARIISNGNERIAIFRNGNAFSAISNKCAHQGGPLGEGRIVDGLITCPWHGYQYQTEDGCSPPPFNEKVSTFEVKLIGEQVFINPVAKSPGTQLEPATLN